MHVSILDAFLKLLTHRQRQLAGPYYKEIQAQSSFCPWLQAMKLESRKSDS